MSWIQQWMLYAAGALIGVLLIASGVQTFRISNLQKDITVITAKYNEEKASNLANKGALGQIKASSDALEARVLSSQEVVIDSQKKATETLRKLLSITPSPVSGDCKEMIDWAKTMAIRRKK